MNFNLERYLQEVNSNSYTLRASIQFLYPDETVQEEVIGDVRGGTYTVNLTNGIRRNLDLELILDEEYIPRFEGLVWIGSKFKFSLGILVDGEDMLLEQGVFIATNPRLSSRFSKRTIQLRGVDKFGGLNGTTGGITNRITQVPNGTNIESYIRGTLTTYNDNIEPIIDSDIETKETVYTIREDTGRPIAETLYQVRNITSANMYYDTSGIFVFERDREDINKSSVFDFSTERPAYLGCTFNFELDQVRNTVVVIGDNIHGDIARFEAVNNNPLSDTSVSALNGLRLTHVISDDVISTDDEAELRAEYELKRLSIISHSISISSIPLIHLDVDQVITLTDASIGLDRERLLISRITIPLSGDTTGTTMTINATRTDDLSLT